MMFRKTTFSGIASAVAVAVFQIPLATTVLADERMDPGPIATTSSEVRQARYLLSTRASLGGGERVGLAAEYWLGDRIGAGLVGVVMQQQTGAFVDLGPGTWSAAWSIAPVVVVRSAPGSSYFVASLGAGFAAVTRQKHGGFLCLEGCGQWDRTKYAGYALESSVGWLAHPGGSQFEIGPIVRFEAVGDYGGGSPVDYLATLNLELGFGLKRP